MRSVLASALLILLLVSACAPPPVPDLPPTATLPAPPELDAEEVALGTAVYAQHCAECHGANLEGQAEWKTPNEDGSFRAPPHTAQGHTWHHGDTVLREAIREGGARFAGQDIGGSSNMPAYDEVLSEEEITAVLAFIKNSWPQDVREMQWAMTLQDQRMGLVGN